VSTFITGSSGFIGLALTEHLLTRGDTVVGFDRAAPHSEAMAVFEGLSGRFVPEIGDVRNYHVLQRAMKRHRPRQLVTLAAVTADAERERATPGLIFDVNVGGVIAAIKVALACGVVRVVHVGSGAVYGSAASETTLHEDRTPLRPEGLYGISKQAAEAAALRLASLHSLELVVGRLGTCFGPWEADSGMRDTPSAPLQIVRLAEAGTPVVLPRPGRRDWLYVRDAAAGLVALLDHPRLPCRIYNVAAGFIGTMAQWCQEIALRQPGFSWQVAGDMPPDSAPMAACNMRPNVCFYAAQDRAPMDISRLSQDTGFNPQFDLPQAAGEFWAWRKRHATFQETVQVPLG
jgi:UDP-glucuronate 4-epimerase